MLATIVSSAAMARLMCLALRKEVALMRRIVMLVTVTLVMAAMMSAMAAPAFPAARNFGHCASAEARYFPPGPEHGKDMSLARFYNPHGSNLQCRK
jgi:hypothetical protein